VSAVPVASAVGRALVETARGLLMHEVVLDGEFVADYLIVAPTEWNFHPQGVLHNRLLGADARDRNALHQQVARLVTTLDPCVPWELQWA
jgi:Ni,Fe-hydrogenase I large subunit